MTYKAHLKDDQYATPLNYQTRTAIFESGDNPQNYWEWLVDIYDFKVAKNILELGCGDGRLWEYAAPLLSQAHQVTVTDFSQGMLDAAQAVVVNVNSKAAFSYQIEDAESLSLPDGSNDLVMAHLLLHHFDDPTQSLSEIKRVLTPAGFAGITAFPAHLFKSILDVVNCLLPEGDFYTTSAIRVPDDEFEVTLNQHFDVVQKHHYDSVIRIVDPEIILAFVKSLSSLTYDRSLPDNFFERLREHVQHEVDQKGFFETSFNLTLFLVQA